MFGKHVTKHLSAYLHGELTPGEKLRVDAHLPTCSKCRAALDEIRFGARLAATLPPSSAPESIWNELDEARRPLRRRRWIPRLAAAGLASAAVLAVILFYRANAPEAPSWEVANIRGTPRIGNAQLTDVGRLRAGEALQTDGSSEAQVKIADIGQLTIAPNTRIRLLVTRSDEHRIALDRGKLEATTLAPPRLFIVDTPSATAIDLGCQYTLEVEDDGSSLLHVTLGIVALQSKGPETVVPAGAFCRTRPGAGPGTPYFDDSSAALQSALNYVDFGEDGPERGRQLEIVLSESRIRDALTLWHLLPRVSGESRGLVYDRLARLIPPPAGVTREGIGDLDPKMLDAWKEKVAQLF